MLNYNNILIRQCSQPDDITLTLPLVDMARINKISQVQFISHCLYQ